MVDGRRKEQSKEDIRQAAWNLLGQLRVGRVAVADIARKAGSAAIPSWPAPRAHCEVQAGGLRWRGGVARWVGSGRRMGKRGGTTPDSSRRAVGHE